MVATFPRVSDASVPWRHLELAHKWANWLTSTMLSRGSPTHQTWGQNHTWPTCARIRVTGREGLRREAGRGTRSRGRTVTCKGGRVSRGV